MHDGMLRAFDECSRSLRSINMCIDNIGCNLNSLGETLASSSQMIKGSLSGETEINPQAHCNVILPRRGDEDLVRQKLKEKEQLEENEKALEEIAKLLESPYDEKIVKKDKTPKVVKSEGPRVDNSNETWMEKETSSASLHAYEPKLPFPPRVYTKREKSIFSEFKKGLGQIGITLPLNEKLAQVPLQMKFIKDILANKERVEEVMQLFETTSKPLRNPKELIKLGDPGKFIIPCSLGDVVLDDALCDSGACVNVISLAMAKEIGIKEMKPDATSITFGDASSKIPVGLVEDFPIIVGGCIVPTDLLVVDMVESKKQPLVLGTPFLNTVGAKIDFVNKKVMLTNVNNKIFYPIKCPLNKSCGTITRGEPKIKENEGFTIEDTSFLVMDVLKVENKFGNEVPLVKGANLLEVETKLKEEAQKVKVAKITKKKKLEKALCEPHGSSPPSLTFKPLKFIDGKLECKVTSKGHSKPFAKARIILDPGSKENDLGVIKKTMASAFGIKIDDRGPPFQDGSPSTSP